MGKEKPGDSEGVHPPPVLVLAAGLAAWWEVRGWLERLGISPRLRAVRFPVFPCACLWKRPWGADQGALKV